MFQLATRQVGRWFCNPFARPPVALAIIGNRHGLPPGFGANQIIASSYTVAMHIHGTRLLFKSSEKM
jgi:hypothetical protein